MKDNDKNRPISIVMTPTRNEAWVIRAFLECNGLWADYIIIADQMSTDGTREIVAAYNERSDKVKSKRGQSNHRAEVILIDNNQQEFNEPERQAKLIAKAREVAAGRDTLLWGLDADEILPANWQETTDGKRILNSQKGDVFYFKWANIAPDKKHYGDAMFQPWLFHDDGVEPHGNYVRNMHSMRIPYPIEEKQLHYVHDFHILHCGFLDRQRVAAKNRFYQLVDWELNHRNPVSLARVYFAHFIPNQPKDYPFKLSNEWIAFSQDLWSLVEIGATKTWFDDYVFERIHKYSIIQLRKLDLWDKDFLTQYAVKDERRWGDKLVHAYIHKTDKCKNRIFIRAIDKVLRLLY